MTHVATFLASVLSLAFASIPPAIDIVAPPALQPVARRLQRLDNARLTALMRLVGVDTPGAPVRVVLAGEDSVLARTMPGWIAGYAEAHRDLIVIFPQRTPSYPDGSLEEVLQHEVAHVLIARAARGQPVPRWFNEGLAMAAERVWGLEDQGRLIAELARGRRISLRDLDARFLRDRASSAGAYTLAGAFVRELIERHGPDLPGRVLAGTAVPLPFDDAFERAAGESLEEAEEVFWSRRRFWTDWALFLTSSTVIWMIVTLLALYAFRRRRAQRAAVRARWDEAEDAPIDGENR